MANELILENKEKSESAYFPGIKEDNSNNNFIQEFNNEPIESSSSNKSTPFIVFNRKNLDIYFEGQKRDLVNKQNFYLPKLFLENSYFEENKRNLIDIIIGFKKQSFFISSNLPSLGNYIWITRDVIKRLIGPKFKIKDEEEVLNFLINYQDHFDKILEFYAIIFEYIKDPKLELEYLKDPEEDCETINMVVKVNLSPSKAIEIEDQVFSNYFEEIFTDKHFKLNFRVESNEL